MFAADVPTYRIDLETPESQRWAEVIAREGAVARRLVTEAGAAFERVPELLRWIFARLYQRSAGLYRDEIQSWADGLGVSLGTATMLNCAYELSHLRWPKILGCTAGARWLGGLGMVHVRTLDWPLPTMGNATRLFRFCRGTREFVCVGVPGQVGVLSGMAPHGYSATINWAPPVAFPSFDFGPTFLLRDVLESCDTYDQAVDRLTKTHLAASVFFTVCGVEKDQACVIERTQKDAVVRPPIDGVVVQTNHHVAGRFVKNNEDIRDVPEGEEEFSIDGSTQRTNILSRALAELPESCTLETAAHALEIPTVLNKFTVQQMAFCPRTGDVRVWRNLDG
jgi:Acyl-coenzyme A:6-aminopenicillanic acid acyl-transferase